MFRFSLFVFLLLAPSVILAQSYDVEIFANVPGCGDNIIQSGEQCDGTNLGGSTCSLTGFDSGNLSCSTVCTLVTAACVINPPQGGGTQISFAEESGLPAPVMTNLVVTGFFMPFGRVSILKDGVVSSTVFADNVGYFQVTLSGLAPGEYLLKLSGSGEGGSMVFTGSFFGQVFKDSTTKISGIILPPLSTVTVGESGVLFRGQSVPGALVLLDLGGASYETRADTYGNFLFENIKTYLSEISYRLGVNYLGETIYSDYKVFKGANTSPCSDIIDVTNDCRINFVDFAITLWWYIYSPAESKIDFDNNGRLDLVDFSIMAYYWTG